MRRYAKLLPHPWNVRPALRAVAFVGEVVLYVLADVAAAVDDLEAAVGAVGRFAVLVVVVADVDEVKSLLLADLIRADQR